METQEVMGLLARYFVLILFGFFGISLFYFVFTPLTVWPVYLVLHKLYAAQLLEGNVIFFKGYYANILEACVAGAAYLGLLTLNLITPMRLNIRIRSLIVMFGIFLIINILRIIIFSMIVSVGYKYFDIAHLLTWYLGSTLLVVVVWFATVWIFRIESVPLYTDAHSLWQDIFSKNRSYRP